MKFVNQRLNNSFNELCYIPITETFSVLLAVQLQFPPVFKVSRGKDAAHVTDSDPDWMRMETVSEVSPVCSVPFTDQLYTAPVSSALSYEHVNSTADD